MTTMLALDVNLLTTKLQKQTLEEQSAPPTTTAAAGPNIKLINPETGYKLSESAQAKLAAAGQGKKLFTVSLSSDASKAGDATSAKVSQQPQAARDCLATSAALTKVLCAHKKPYNACGHCDTPAGPTAAAAHSDRPKKRHSRSMSVPQETEISIPPPKSTWQPQGSGLWKPVATAASFTHGCERKWDVRSVHWSPTESRNYEFSSIASSMQRQMATGHITPDDLLTPPESPVPRPNSVYSDGAISPFTGDPCADYMYTNKLYHISEFRNRSLSVEDKISSCTVTSCVTGAPGATGSMPSSPHHRYRIPRCRSQPSFYDRKSGRRRRRDYGRPTLNFNKMTETAYGLQIKPAHLVSPAKDQGRGSCFHDDLESVMSLMPIASSPRDTDMPVIPATFSAKKDRTNGPIHEVEFPHRDSVNISEESSSNTPGPVKLLGEEDEDENGMEVFQFTEELDLEQIENH